MERWSRVLTEDILNECAMPIDKNLRLLRVLIDTRTAEVRALSEDQTHELAASARLRDELKGERLTPKTAQLASHLVGAVITAQTDRVCHGVIMESTHDTQLKIAHAQAQIDKAARILTDYLYRSPIVRESKVEIRLRAA